MPIIIIGCLFLCCGPTGSVRPHAATVAHHDLAEWWQSEHGVTPVSMMASCPIDPIVGPLYLQGIDGLVCLATDGGGSIVYAYPRSQQTMAAEVTLAHEWGHYVIDVFGWSQSEALADCLAGAYYGDTHGRWDTWWSGWMVPYRVGNLEDGAERTGRERRRDYMRGARGGMSGCLE